MSAKGYDLEDYPMEETFRDCRGAERIFVITAKRFASKYFITATERNSKGEGYEFATSSTDPYAALGQLRSKIRKGLATRYLSYEQGRRFPSHDEIKGRIGFGGVVIDGEFMSFKDFAEMLQTHEGWRFCLKIVDLVGDA